MSKELTASKVMVLSSSRRRRPSRRLCRAAGKQLSRLPHRADGNQKSLGGRGRFAGSIGHRLSVAPSLSFHHTYTADRRAILISPGL